MIDIYSIQNALGEAMFRGDVSLAGVCMFAAAIVVLFAVFGRRDITVPTILMLPVALIFSTMSLIPTALTILIVLASVMIIATKAKSAL